MLTNAILQLIEDESLYSKYEKEGPSVYEELAPLLIEEKWINAFRQIKQS